MGQKIMGQKTTITVIARSIEGESVETASN